MNKHNGTLACIRPNNQTSLSMFTVWMIVLAVLSSPIISATPLSGFAQKNLLLPPPPTVNAEAYIIIDAKTGSILSEKNAQKRMAPASLTKLMTSYVVFHALKQGHLHLSDDIHISTNAWKTEGSRLFLNENSTINLQTLLKGVIITSGNDASVAISEHFAGSEDNFALIMNRYAEKIGLSSSHFITATGLDHEQHYSTAQDLATLSSHIIHDFPEYFHWFHEQSITHNGITQKNRNTLLSTHPEIDGLKTGHTNKAGYCLATTAQQNNTRLVVITLNSPSKKSRDNDTIALLNYGFRFYETALLYPKDTIISNTQLYRGVISNIDIKNKETCWATIPKGTHNSMQIDLDIQEPLTAPQSQDVSIGTLTASIEGHTVGEYPVYPNDDIQETSGIKYMIDTLKLWGQGWFL
ncbi:D-alanyl-D-alanine carboxypeptidase family protein [Candidatus Synchoanobacter obligatus]|uniref:serine-type D-Ala-D-Ala carboxypeptidase n=1 Tax=Candidatus Synchoanobacter obligatus TaxID=2919597 RepID=A0ABT1L5E5_9GAMM|nr:D-alanyl-D-alanine carboxypeptidase family protein [Candidatus Synchoanobacter obligatus]MCP8351945.1 D-alanyl-D-alanine carboxypeptidase [Candidatus Synchoanobacter obligatus]